MITLLNGVKKKILRNEYHIGINSVSGTGTVVLSFSVGGRPFQNIRNASYTGSDSDIADLPGCFIKATITGDSTVDLLEKD